jgi:hypothetical protein
MTPKCSSAEAMKQGVGRKSGCCSAPTHLLSRPLPLVYLSLRSRSSNSAAALCASYSAGAGTSLHTSVGKGCAHNLLGDEHPCVKWLWPSVQS